ncbi:MAG: hypothetical protein IH614_01610 [Desulfuromonadales bacterium]|nr:hypothetical protein [Desulfuromonadales bacterium]
MEKAEKHGLFGFLDGLFRSTAPPPAAQNSPEVHGLKELRDQFDATIQRLEVEIETRQRELTSPEMPEQRQGETVINKVQLEALRHQEIREDIEAMHQRLGTSLGGAELDELRAFLLETEQAVAPGRESRQVLPRARFSIVRRFHFEAGKLAWEQLTERLSQTNLSWPETAYIHSFMTAEEIGQLRQSKREEARQAFLQNGLRKSSELLLGVVAAWKSDYPERGTPLWQMVVLEGVATAFQAQLLKQLVARLRREQPRIEAQVASLLGAEIQAIDSWLQQGVGSLDKANRLYAESLQLLDEKIPELVWQQISLAE